MSRAQSSSLAVQFQLCSSIGFVKRIQRSFKRLNNFILGHLSIVQFNKSSKITYQLTTIPEFWQKHFQKKVSNSIKYLEPFLKEENDEKVYFSCFCNFSVYLKLSLHVAIIYLEFSSPKVLMTAKWISNTFFRKDQI